MDSVTVFLLLLAGLFLLGAAAEIIFARSQLPDVVWLITAGIILGPVTGIVPRAMLDPITPYFAALTLIIVLFEGGSRLVIADLVKAAPRASLLAVLGFVLTTAGIALFSMLLGTVGILEEWSLPKGVMLGAILGGSSSIIIMPSMALGKVEEKVASLVSLESALTDALCVVVALAMMDLIASGTASAGDAGMVLLKNFGIALLIGVAAGWMWMPVLKLLAGNPHAYPATFAALILLYVIVGAAGGSAAMGILAFAVMVGNAQAILRRVGFSMGEQPLELDFSVRTIHSQMSFIVKSFFFTFIGMMMSPPWSMLLIGVIMGFVLLGARIPAAWLATRGSTFTPKQTKLITVCLPRGMAAGVLATIPLSQGMSGTEHLPAMVFACVFTSIIIFAIAFPMVRRQSPGEAIPAAGAPATSVSGVILVPPEPDPVASTTGVVLSSGLTAGGAMETNPEPGQHAGKVGEREGASGIGADDPTVVMSPSMIPPPRSE